MADSAGGVSVCLVYVVQTNNESGSGAMMWAVSGKGTALSAVCGSCTSDGYLTGVGVDGAGHGGRGGRWAVLPPPPSPPPSYTTLRGVAPTNAGSAGTVLWKVSGEGTPRGGPCTYGGRHHGVGRARVWHRAMCRARGGTALWAACGGGTGPYGGGADNDRQYGDDHGRHGTGGMVPAWYQPTSLDFNGIS